MSGSDDWGGRIETYTGRSVDVFDPSPADIHLRDVAAGLARTCRFGGHCERFYSVAHHSIHVSEDVPGDDPRLQLLALFHDAGEAYVGDVPRPIKARFEGFERAERRLLRAVWSAFDLAPPSADEWEAVMAADDRLLAYEAANLLADGTWASDPPERSYALHSEPISAVRDRFSSRAESLLADLDS